MFVLRAYGVRLAISLLNFPLRPSCARGATPVAGNTVVRAYHRYSCGAPVRRVLRGGLAAGGNYVTGSTHRPGLIESLRGWRHFHRLSMWREDLP
jgi:hypothetical protein